MIPKAVMYVLLNCLFKKKTLPFEKRQEIVKANCRFRIKDWLLTCAKQKPKNKSVMKN